MSPSGLHRTITASTPVRANRVVALLSKMFAISVEREWRVDNPCRAIKKNREHARSRHLTSDEMGRLMAALTASPYRSSSDATMLLLLTGSQRAEVLAAEWHEFDLERGVWSKPASRTKADKPHRTDVGATRQLPRPS
jgi:integrase